jgi:acetyltransferase-like isoleucine patch superfamily enzyme
MSLHEVAKATARVMATVAVLPALCSFQLRAAALGRDRALMGSTQWLGLIPGLVGQYLRRAFLARALARCAPSAAIEWGTVFSDAGTIIEEHVYIGPGCHIGLAHIERDVLIGPCVHVPSGRLTHGVDNPDDPIRDQPGVSTRVHIGANSWIGAGAIVMADVGAATIVGAGSVVTRPLPARVVAAGVPARVLRQRGPVSPSVDAK